VSVWKNVILGKDKKKEMARQIIQIEVDKEDFNKVKERMLEVSDSLLCNPKNSDPYYDEDDDEEYIPSDEDVLQTLWTIYDRMENEWRLSFDAAMREVLG